MKGTIAKMLVHISPLHLISFVEYNLEWKMLSSSIFVFIFHDL